MKVTVSFTLDVDVAEWVYRDNTTIVGKDEARRRVAVEVPAHAEYVVTELFRDMGWLTPDTDN